MLAVCFQSQLKKILFYFIFSCVVFGEAEHSSVLSAGALSLAVFNAFGD